MTRVLVTGGTGVLGQELVPRLLAADYTVRVMSRRAPRPGEEANVEWAEAQLTSGEGLAEAVQGADVIVHAASSPVKRAVDVDGTRQLLHRAREAGVGHLVYISIVGIDRFTFSYYQNKLAAERLIEASGVPWSILRATQFHSLIDMALGGLTRLPVAFVPTGFQFQVITAGEAADHMIQAVQAGPSGRLPDVGGPEVLRLGDMARAWLAAQGMRRRIVHLPLPGKVAGAFRQGFNTTPENRVGSITWADWLAARYSGLRSGDSNATAEQTVEGVLSP